MDPEIVAAEQVVDEILGVLVRGGDLLEYHRPLALDLVGIEHRVEKNILQDVHRQRQVLVHHLGVVTGSLPAGESIDDAADGVHFLGDPLRATPVGSLEQQVFDEVRQSALPAFLVTGAVPHPDAQAHRPGPGALLRQNPDAVVQNGLVEH